MIILLDNSRISHFKSCPMQFKIRDILHWTRDTAKPAMDFGACFHEGFAALFKNINKGFGQGELLEMATFGFQSEWNKKELPSFDDMIAMDDLFPRVPGVAGEMYENYISQKWDWFTEIEVLEVEKPFLVPLITPEDNILYKGEPVTVYLCGRRDVVIKDQDGIWVVEHKTSSLYSKDYGLQYRFTNGFNPNSQVDTYAYATKLQYGDKARGVYINGCLVHSKRHDIFKVIPIYKSEGMLESWYNDTRFYVEQLLRHQESGYWPHNVQGCYTPYGTCEFKEICETCDDPEKIQADIFPGYKIEKWEPFDEATLKELLDECTNA